MGKTENKSAPKKQGANLFAEYECIVRRAKKGYTVDAIVFMTLAFLYAAVFWWYCTTGGGVSGALVILINIIAAAVQAGHYWRLRSDQNLDY